MTKWFARVASAQEFSFLMNWALCCLVVVGCTKSDPRGNSAPAARPGPFFVVHLAVDHEVERWTAYVDEMTRKTWYLDPTAIITQDDITAVQESVDASGRRAILLSLNNAAAGRLSAATEQRVGDWIAMMVDGRVVYMPRLHSQLSSQIMIVDDGESRLDIGAFMARLKTFLRESGE